MKKTQRKIAAREQKTNLQHARTQSGAELGSGGTARCDTTATAAATKMLSKTIFHNKGSRTARRRA